MDFETENSVGLEDAGGSFPAEESGGTPDAGREGVVAPRQDGAEQDGQDAGESAGDDSGSSPQSGDEDRAGSSDGGDADRQGTGQSREFNAAMAAARRRAEKETAERLERERDEKIAALKIPNPASPGTFFGGMKDLEAYGGQLRRADAEKRAKAQGRDVAEVMAEDEERAFIREQMDKASKTKAAEDEARRQQEFIAADLADFQARWPDVDIAKLDANRNFRRFAGSRYGKEPLADLYSDYLAIAGEAAAAASARSSDRQERGTGAGSGGGSGGALTAEQRAELREWNANFPEMKMSEKEFLDMQ